MSLTVKRESRSVEAAHRRNDSADRSNSVQRADVCQPLNGPLTRPLNLSSVDPEQRPFLEALSGRDAVRVQNAALSAYCTFCETYQWAR